MRKGQIMRTALLIVALAGLSCAAHAKPIAWLDDFGQATRQAQQSGKPIFVWYFADT